jgi:hypothetical protein
MPDTKNIDERAGVSSDTSDAVLTPDNSALPADPSVADAAGAPVRRAVGAPKKNRNGIRSGLQSFMLGRLPPGCSHVSRYANQLRRQLRAAVTLKHGSTNVWLESVIVSACTHEIRRILLGRWLRLADDPETTRKSSSKNGLSVSVSSSSGLSITEKAAILDRIGSATNERDKCLRLLGLDERETSDPWSMLKQPSMLAAILPPTAALAGPATQTTADGRTDVPEADASAGR